MFSRRKRKQMTGIRKHLIHFALQDEAALQIELIWWGSLFEIPQRKCQLISRKTETALTNYVATQPQHKRFKNTA